MYHVEHSKNINFIYMTIHLLRNRNLQNLFGITSLIDLPEFYSYEDCSVHW